MKIWCAAWTVATWWYVAVAGDCGITIGNHTYREETLVSGVPNMRSLAVDFNTHNAYFSFMNGSTVRNAKVDLKSKGLNLIKELRAHCWYTVDQMRGHVHAGCPDEGRGIGGLYQWDSNTGRFELAGEAGRHVHFVHYWNDTLYYSYSFNATTLLRTFTDGHSVLMSAPASGVWELVVDARGDFIFSNITGLYRRRSDSGEETRYETISDWVWALAVDGDGAVHTCDTRTPRGVWRLDGRALTATRLLDVPCKALTFDADGNLVYGDIERNSIVRLVKC